VIARLPGKPDNPLRFAERNPVPSSLHSGAGPPL